MENYPLAQYFEEVAGLITNQTNLKSEPTTDDKKTLYGLYKQATVGDVNTARPGIFDLTGKAKWDAWNQYKGTPQEKAKQEYVEFCKKFFKDEIAAKYN